MKEEIYAHKIKCFIINIAELEEQAGAELGQAPGVNILQQNRKLFPDKIDQKWVTFPNLLSKLSKKGKLFPDGYPQIM